MIRELQSACKELASLFDKLYEAVGPIFALYLGSIVLPSVLVGVIALNFGFEVLMSIAAWPFKIALFIVAISCFVIGPVYLVATLIGSVHTGGGDDGSLQRGTDFDDDGGE